MEYIQIVNRIATCVKACYLVRISVSPGRRHSMLCVNHHPSPSLLIGTDDNHITQLFLIHCSELYHCSTYTCDTC